MVQLGGASLLPFNELRLLTSIESGRYAAGACMIGTVSWCAAV